MKKITALILSIITLAVIICSCGKNTKPVETATDENGDIINTATTKEQATTKSTSIETTSATQMSTETNSATETTTHDPTVNHFPNGVRMTCNFTETPTRIIYTPTISRHLCYYDKINDEVYIFCFDPLCEHKKPDCISTNFGLNRYGGWGLGDSVIYCEYNNRIYATRGEQIYSFKFDGSDLKLEYSFGEDGKNFNSNYNEALLTTMRAYDNYLYMIRRSDYTGNKHLYRYDVNTKKMENLSLKEGNGEKSNVFSYLFTDNKLFIEMSTEEDGLILFITDMDMRNGVKKEPNENIVKYSVYDGKYIYYFEYPGMTKMNIETGEKELLFEQYTEYPPATYEVAGQTIVVPGGYVGPSIMQITDKFIYYTRSDNTQKYYVGEQYMGRNRGYESYYQKRCQIWVMNKETLERKMIYDDLYLTLDEFYITSDGEKAIVQASNIVLDDQKHITSIDQNQYTFDIAPDGSFVNMHELVLDE